MNALAIRDSSLDQRTYWLRDGLYYSRSSNLGEPAACEIPADILAKIPEGDRIILIEEAAASPSFCNFVTKLLRSDSNWVHRISDSAKAAAMNVLDPSKPYIKGSWPVLRARVRALAVDVANQATRMAAQLTPAERFETVKRIAAGGLKAPQAKGLGDLGQWDIIGSLVGSLATAGSNLYGAKVTADAQQDIAKIQASAAMQSAQAQIAMAQANAAIANAQVQVSNPITSTLQSMTSATVAGVPVIVPVLGAVALALFFAFGRK